MMKTKQTMSKSNGSSRDPEAGVSLYEPGPRLEPIENPDSWWVWLAYKMAEWTVGAVITPVKVVQARFPESIRQAYETQKLEDSVSLPDGLRTLLKRQVAATNGCAFCVDMVEAEAESHDLDVGTLRDVTDGKEAPEELSDRVRAALDYAEAVTEDVHVPDETFAKLEAHFSEREIVEITWLCAVENYYNRISVPLGIGSDGLCSV